VQAALGRGTGGHVARSLELADEIRARGLRLKLNTVVTVKPLHELELLALRSAQQLRRRHARLRQTTFAVGAVALRSSSAPASTPACRATSPSPPASCSAASSCSRRRAQVAAVPPRRRSAQLAEMADAMATNLRLRMRALDEIVDAKARQLEQWKTVLDVTEAVHRPRAPAA
jgi:hypothetical protein